MTGRAPSPQEHAIRRYAAALFDLDGTLVDSGRDVVAAVRHALSQVLPGREQPPDEDILVLIGQPLEAVAHALGCPSDEESTRRFADAYRAHYAEHYNDHTRVYPGIRELLEMLRGAGVKLALVTTKHQTQAEFTLAGAGLARCFDYVHGWLEGRKHKPDPEPILTALRELDVQPRAAIMVGDSELDIQSAKAAGVGSCAVTYGFRPAWFLVSFHPDFVVSHPADIGPIVASQDAN
ncbi:HAD-IA family hydrolase [candidate division WOR-3 bacterium]|nr:HAD-IA family hydrolase [candidate division WOR-3 bacterium]